MRIIVHVIDEPSPQPYIAFDSAVGYEPFEFPGQCAAAFADALGVGRCARCAELERKLAAYKAVADALCELPCDSPGQKFLLNVAAALDALPAALAGAAAQDEGHDGE